MISSQRTMISLVTYGFLAFGAAWLLWTAFEIRYLQGWYEAQGVDRFHYPSGELVAGALALVAGFMLARTKGWPLAVVLAVFVVVITEVYWVGFTR